MKLKEGEGWTWFFIVMALVMTGLWVSATLHWQVEEKERRRLQNKLIAMEAKAVGLRLKALDFEISAINFINQNQEYFLGLGCTAFDETQEQIEAKMSVLPTNIGRGGK
jgi:hypothetical protein